MQSPFIRRIGNLPTAIWSTVIQIDELKGRWIQGAQLNRRLKCTNRPSYSESSAE